MRIVALVWLAGCLLFGLQLLRMRSFCVDAFRSADPVTDAGRSIRRSKLRERRSGSGYVPRLLVTPESISPCIVGILRPRIIVPESLVTDSSTTTLRHVLAHELAHIVPWRLVDELAASPGACAPLVQSRGLVDDPGDAGRARSGLRRPGARRR